MNFYTDHIQNLFSFQLINSQRILQSQVCKAIAINNSNNVILAASGKCVKLFQFCKGEMKQLKIVTIHKKIVTTLTICRMKTNYLSTSKDNSIIISSFLLAASSKYIQRLQEHKKPINCLILHPNQENIFISGCDDGAIIFWNCNNNQWQKQQVIKEYQNSYLGDIYGLSMNPQREELISCTHRSQIIIMTKSTTDSCWKIKQIIKDGFGYRIGFITCDIFAFQLRSSSELIIYRRQLDETFQKLKVLSVKGGNQPCDYYFPIVYIPQKKLFLSKNGHYLNIISSHWNLECQEISTQNPNKHNMIENNLNFKIVQTIEIKQKYWGEIYGVVSNDGQYLIQFIQTKMFLLKYYFLNNKIYKNSLTITWSDSEKQILIRKYTDEQLLIENDV